MTKSANAKLWVKIANEQAIAQLVIIDTEY
jgi:hypothetical protein